MTYYNVKAQRAVFKAYSWGRWESANKIIPLSTVYWNYYYFFLSNFPDIN